MRAFLDNLGRDLRYTRRSLFRQPLLVTAAALSIGVAVAANAVIFGLANDLLLSAPSARQPEQLAYLRTANSSHVSYPQWSELNESGALAGIAGYQIEIEVNWTGPEQSISMLPLIVTPNFFDLLGVPIAQGRGFTTAEALPERQAGVAVISHTFWQNRLGGDPAAVGRVLTFNGRPYTVLGILPAGLRAVPGLGIAPEVYLPISRDLLPEIDRRDSSAVMLIGRLHPDQGLQQGRAALQTVMLRLDQEHGVEELGGVRQFAGAGGLRQIGAFDDLAVFFAILGIAVALVLTIACANVAGLLLSRGVGQGREAALRAALGASRSRLVQQQLTEAGWLALLGTTTGILLSVATSTFLTRLRLPLPLPIELHAGIDFRLLTMSLVMLVAVTLLSGLLPAVRLTRPSLLPAIKSGAGQAARRRWSLRPVLVTSQVAVALVLLLTAFLFVRNLSRAQEVDPGFDTAHTLVAQIGFVEGRHTADSRAAFLAAAIERLTAHPGIRAATYARGVPLTLRSGTTTGTDLKMTDGGEAFRATYQSNAVGPAYFSTMGIRLIAGREFLQSDRPGSPLVAIVSEEFVRRYLGGRSPLGRQLLLPGPRDQSYPVEIVGVVADTRYRTIGEERQAAVYESFLQRGNRGRFVHVLVSAEGSGEGVTREVQRTLASMDPTSAVEVEPMREALAFAFLPSQLGAWILGTLGLLGLGLAMMGLYATIASSVSRRTFEIGVRMALGATRRAVLALVLRDAAILAITGITIGVALAVFITPPLAMFLVAGLSPSDPLTFAGTAALLLIVSLAAAASPALRAMRVEPVQALRME